MKTLAVEQLMTTVRPVVADAQGVLERLLPEGSQVPTIPAPRFAQEADGTARQWVATKSTGSG